MRLTGSVPGHMSPTSACGRALALAAVALIASGCMAPAGSPSASTPLAGSTSPGGSASTSTPGSAGSASPSTSAMQRFEDDRVAFGYPVGWAARPGSINPSGNVTIVFVGSTALPSDCAETANGGVCYPWPVMTLKPGEIVVAWRDHGMPGSTPPMGGEATTVGRRAATIIRGPADKACAAIGGKGSIAVAVPKAPGQVGWTGIDACLVGPGDDALEATFAAMLASATIH